MLVELIVALVVKAPDGGILDGAVHALDLAVGPRVPWLGQAVFDIELGEGKLRSSVNGDEEVELASSVRASAMSMWK
jgi:hypothetical protein